ncbi:MAG: hypothetical protein ACR2MT_10570, partial [Aurantibacter sp.]
KKSENTLSRLHSLWTLEGLGTLETSALKKALQDSVDGVRENAIKITELRLNNEPQLTKDLIGLTRDTEARVRMQAALTLGTLNEENYAAQKEALAKSMAEMILDSQNDVWATRAIASAVERQGLSFSQYLLNTRKEDLSATGLAVLSILAENLGKNHDVPGLSNLVTTMRINGHAVDVKTKLVEAMASGWEKGSKSRLDSDQTRSFANALDSIESEKEIALISASGNLRRAMGLPTATKISGMMKKAGQSIFDSRLSVAERLEQLQLLKLGDFKNRSELLYRLLDSKQPLVLQEEALTQLSDADDATVGKRLLELWSGLGPQARKTATDILLYKSHNHDALLTAMENNLVNLGEFNLDLERRRTLLMWSGKDIQERAKKLFSDAGVVQRKEAIEAMGPALAMNGSPVQGADIFDVQCAQCHRYGNDGEDVGPVLTEVNRKSKESLLHDILDPNAAIDTKYLNHQLKTKEGNILSGLVFRETDSEIGLKMIGGDERIIQKSEIEQFSSLGRSMMPEGLETNMSHQEMADLLAFLQQ